MVIMTYEWKNKEEKVLAKLVVDDNSGIEIQLCPEEKAKHGKEIEELQTLNLYPPVDETKVTGENGANEMTVYRIKPSRKWELAKQDIVATFKFWMDGETNLFEQ